MNEEPVHSLGPGNIAQSLDAIMVEVHSWGGHSGSPAYVLFPPTRWMNQLELSNGEPRSAWALLGLVSSHWNLPAAIQSINEDRVDDNRKAMVNTGIGLVTSGQHIRDLLLREDVVADRERRP